MTNFPLAAASQKGWVTGVISGRGFLISFAGSAMSNLLSQDRGGGTAKILSVIHGSQTGNKTDLRIRHLACAAFPSKLPHRFDHMDHAAGGRGLATIDYSAAGLNGEIPFEGEIGFFKEFPVVFPAEAQIFDLQHDDRDIV